jgi:AcrR family transcriptional regulator
VTNTERTVRRRDATRTREALLRAARELFGLHGYRGTTLRDVGERAGVDPALVARYFGNKLALYLASFEADDTPPPGRLTAHELIERIVERTERVGPGPLLSAAVAPADPEVQDVARRRLTERLVGPVRRGLDETGADRPALRAEVAVAALVGVALARSAGTFDALAGASQADVVSVTAELLAGVLDT